MRKTVLSKAAVLALATLGAGSALAQSSLTIYGNVDVSIDNVNRSAGLPAAGGTKLNTTRVSPSATSQTSFGFRGVEDLGGGLKGSFVMEGQLSHDTGSLAQDGRIFGRQAYVGLTTPFGEFRLGRQYAPIFYSTAFVTTERFGATDLFTEFNASNNLQVRWDNQVSYWLRAGGFTGALAYSPNAGVPSTNVNSLARGAAGTGTDAILGGANAGGETDGRQGRAAGAFASFVFEPVTITGAYHMNYFDNVRLNVGVPPATTIPTGLFLDDYRAWNLGFKFALPGSGITFNGQYGQGNYDLLAGSSVAEIEVQGFAVGTRIPVGNWAFLAQYSQTKFTDFTGGKDTGVMLGAEYSLSKRTTLFARAGQIDDDRGTTVGGLTGGPDVIMAATGVRETPVFAGANVNPDGRTRYVGLGVRHSF